MYRFIRIRINGCYLKAAPAYVFTHHLRIHIFRLRAEGWKNKIRFVSFFSLSIRVSNLLPEILVTCSHQRAWSVIIHTTACSRLFVVPTACACNSLLVVETRWGGRGDGVCVYHNIFIFMIPLLVSLFFTIKTKVINRKKDSLIFKPPPRVISESATVVYQYVTCMYTSYIPIYKVYFTSFNRFSILY